MTYTFKLARRLAMSRNLAMLTGLVLVAACAGDTTGPEAVAVPTTPAEPTAPLGFRVLPGNITIETNQRIRFRGEHKTIRGQASAPSLSWKATGGSIDSTGRFSASEPGTYRIIGQDRSRTHFSRQRPDTSVVVVVARQPKLRSITVTPRAPSLVAGEQRTFTAIGELRNGTTAPIGVTWNATGGTIDPAGVYLAGNTAGVFRVIAADVRGNLADTVKVTISLPTPPDTLPTPPAPDTIPTPPTPDTIPTPPAPVLARVVLRPATVTLATLASHQFAAFGRNTVGDSIAVNVTFRATGGTITPTGLYTAGPTAGTYRVVASAEGLADTAVVGLAMTSGGGAARSIPFGPYSAWSGSTTLKTNTVTFTGSIGNVSPEATAARIDATRRMGITLMSAMAGGHEPYLTNGVFEMAKWKAAMDRYNTPAIRQAVAAGVADGTLIGNSVMDEPHVTGTGDGNTWGPRGTMTKVMVDQMCAYVKAIFPTLPVGVVHQHSAFEPDKSYRVCDFIVSQYSHRYGDVTKFRDDALAMGRRDGIAIAFSMNIVNGGFQAPRDGRWNCPLSTTGGRGTYDPNCRMTAAQVREWGLVLGPAGCAMMMWRYDDAFMAKLENQQAFGEIARRLATLPGRPCRRT